MTTDELKKYYSGLLILQYLQKPKARATVEETVEPLFIDQLPVAVENAFEINTAEGVQLDVIGKYVGVNRTAFDFTGPITLDDDDFRTTIRFAIIKNTFGSSLYEIQELLWQFFEGSFLVFDFQNMRMGYFFDSAVGSRPLAEVFVRSNFLPKPMGVQLATLVYSNNITNFFGFQTYELPPFNVTGFNDYDDYSETSPWLNYTDAVIDN